MSALTVEQRLTRLEMRIAELLDELRTIQRPAKDWRRTIGALTGDTGMHEILHEAMRLRDGD